MLLYGLFLTKVFIKAQLPLDGERCDQKRPTTTMKTFSVLGLKPQVQKTEKEKENKKKKVAVTEVLSTKTAKSKPSEESKKKKR